MSSLRLAYTRSCYCPEKYVKIALPWFRQLDSTSVQEASTSSTIEGTTWTQVDYQSQTQLAHALEGVHTVLSFISEQDDPNSPIQKNLIRAAVDAGVKRFAPSEWASWVISCSDFLASF